MEEGREMREQEPERGCQGPRGREQTPSTWHPAPCPVPCPCYLAPPPEGGQGSREEGTTNSIHLKCAGGLAT